MNEKGRYYDLETGGIAQVELKTKPGEFKEPTIKDAIDSGGRFKPSVTTVLKTLRASWNLQQYFRKQAVKGGVLACIEKDLDPTDVDFEDWDFMKLALKLADEHGRKAADEGTSIHASAARWIEKDQVEPEHETQIEQLAKILGKIAPGEIQEITCERSLIGEEYAGTPDMVVTTETQTILIDLKTQEIVPGHRYKGDFSFHEEWAYQLAAYRELLFPMNAPSSRVQCYSVCLDRNPSGLSGFKLWSDEEMRAAWEIFSSALLIWKLQNNYFPEWIEEKIDGEEQ